MKKVLGLALVQRLLTVLGWTVVVCVAGTAGAAPVTYDMTMSLGDDTRSLADLESAGLISFTPSSFGGDYSTVGPITQAGDWQVNSWTSSYFFQPFLDADVTNNLDVTNLSETTQIFSVSVVAPSGAMSGPVGGGGGLRIVLTDTALVIGATLTSALGAPVYIALGDGRSFRTLANDPYSLSCAGSACSASQRLGFGLGSGPPSGASLGITLQFALSPGDSAAIESHFFYNAEPEPTTILLLGSGLAGIALFRRCRLLV